MNKLVVFALLPIIDIMCVYVYIYIKEGGGGGMYHR